MSQPKWKLIANLGDVNPLESGGLFVYVDETGVYPPEAERVWPEEDIDLITVHRFILEPCTFINGILSDNKFHPDKPAWFAKPESERAARPQDSTYLQNLTAYTDPLSDEELAAGFCSDDPLQRARAWELVGLYHGYDNLDSQPLKMTRAEAEARYAGINFRNLEPA